MNPNSYEKNKKEYNIFNDIEYICRSAIVIQEALHKGCDVAQMPNGDIVVTEVKIINNYYSWNQQNKKLTKVGNFV
ncbi:MAG: DUF2671 domain-containing protein [Rickettsiaceae bacterium]|nr:DUF2671 domain-containing protein [Rickettsiaceae bacterium]